jgi:hypothetical protein
VLAAQRSTRLELLARLRTAFGSVPESRASCSALVAVVNTRWKPVP